MSISFTQTFAQPIAPLSLSSEIEEYTFNFVLPEAVRYSLPMLQTVGDSQFQQKEKKKIFYSASSTQVVPKLETLKFTIPAKKQELTKTSLLYSIKKSNPFKNPAFKILGGTRGLSFELNFLISRRINLAVGYSHMNFSVESFETNFGLSEYYASIDADVKLSNFNLMLEYKPGKGGFRMVTGLAWFPQNSLYGAGTLRDGFKFNDITFTPEELGHVGGIARYEWHFNPYAGIGFGRSHPKGRFGFTFDIGVFYKGKPQLEIEASSLARNNVLNQDKIQKIANEYQWWPVIDLGIKYRIF